MSTQPHITPYKDDSEYRHAAFVRGDAVGPATEVEWCLGGTTGANIEFDYVWTGEGAEASAREAWLTHGGLLERRETQVWALPPDWRGRAENAS